MQTRSLEGYQVLVVEPELLILMDEQQMFEDEGANVLTASGVYEAATLAHTPGLDAAVVDFTVGQEDGGVFCRLLTKLGVPFVFCSGRDRETPTFWPEAPFLGKPILPRDLINAVTAVLIRSGCYEG